MHLTAGRAIDEEHWGALVIYTRGSELPERFATLLKARNPDADRLGQIDAALDFPLLMFARQLFEKTSTIVDRQTAHQHGAIGY